MVLDTNILIYATGPDGPRLHRWLADPDATVSVISRIETLGFYKITPEEKSALTAMPMIVWRRMVFKRILLPQAIRQSIPAYSNEIILMRINTKRLVLVRHG